MSEKDFRADSAVILDNTEVFLCNRDASSALRTEAWAYDPVFGSSRFKSRTFNDGALVRENSATFGFPLFSRFNLNSTVTNGSGEMIGTAKFEMCRPLFGPTSWSGDAWDNKLTLQHSTKTTISLGFFSDESDTATKDQNGNVILTSHGVTTYPWLGPKIIDLEFRDGNGTKVGSSKSKIYNYSQLGDGIEYTGAVITIAGLACLGLRCWKPGLITTSIGIGAVYLGSQIPRASVVTEFTRYKN